MSLAFLNPLLLFGLAAVILPVLIHRLTRRKALRRNFSAVRLLLHSRNLIARPQRLKHLLLLALRITAVASLVLMAARPMLVRPGILAVSEEGTRVLILDNSASMGYSDSDGQRYQRAKEAAQAIIKNLQPTSNIFIMPTVIPSQRLGNAPDTKLHSGGDQGGSEEPTQAYSEVRREERRSDSAASCKGNEGIRMKAAWYGWMTKEAAAKYVASLPLSSAKGEPGSALSGALQKLKRVRGSKEIIIISDTAKSDWQRFNLAGIGTIPADVHLTFLRVGGKARDGNVAVKEVRLKEGDLVAGTPIRLEAIIANLSDQPTSTVVQLTMGNTRIGQTVLQFTGKEERSAYYDVRLDRPGSLQGQVRLSPDKLPSDDHVDFALNVREKIKVLVVDGDPRGSMRNSESYYVSLALQPRNAELSPFQPRVVSEKEYGDIDPKTYEALFLLNVAKPQPSRMAALAEQGKHVFIFLGDRVLPEAYNSLPLFPWRLGEIRETDAQRPQHVTRIDDNDEALGQFSQGGKQSLEGAAIRKYFKIVAAPAKGLLTLENQDSLLLKSSFGKGKIFLYASSADADWNDLPLKAAYVSLIQGLVKEAAGLTRNGHPAYTSVGEPAIPSEESDLVKLSDDDVRTQFPGMQVQLKEYSKGPSDRLGAGSRELWVYLLGFLMLAIAIETGLANRL